MPSLPSSYLNDIKIASPCTASWDAMSGDDRVRFCDQCRLNVYNLSAMTRAEAEAFLERTGGRTCIRLYRRADGTVLTEDCPVGIRAIRKRIARAAGAIVSVLLVLVAAIGADAALRKHRKARTPAPQHRVVMGDMVAPKPPQQPPQ